MQLYHWLILVLVILAVIILFTRVAGALMRTVITVVALVMFAGFVWGTIPEENKTDLSTFWESTKGEVVEFVEGIFNFGQTLPDRQEEATRELYK